MQLTNTFWDKLIFLKLILLLVKSLFICKYRKIWCTVLFFKIWLFVPSAFHISEKFHRHDINSMPISFFGFLFKNRGRINFTFLFQFFLLLCYLLSKIESSIKLFCTFILSISSIISSRYFNWIKNYYSLKFDPLQFLFSNLDIIFRNEALSF